ncbi:MAG TPA: hypothetical protein VHP82_10575 [Gaiellaceae bacterium]|jgi:hypothetical protein|nr:hypothetical protein [Gaiellaceae bacterium]
MSDKHDPFRLAESTYHGAGKTLEAALDDAWAHAKGKGAAPGTYRVVDIFFAAENPIREYSVVIGGSGGTG